MKDQSYGAAIDIGTTTVAISLLQADAHELAAAAFINPQAAAAFGADVLSRAKNAASNERTAKRMRTLVCDGIRGALQKLREQAGISDAPLRLVVAGNTTMLHIFSGLPTNGLLAAPFAPADISLRHEPFPLASAAECVAASEKCGTRPVQSGGSSPDAALFSDALIFPCISAFVGGDIVAGIYALSLLEKNVPTLFIDLGTNGEMALAAGGKVFVTSVAAGPAFEGGNISSGMAAVEGAITHVNIRRGFCRAEWIKAADKSARHPEAGPAGVSLPRGICGSGLFDAAAEMYRDGIIDSHGTLADRYIDEGFPVFIQDASHRLVLTQDDIRAFQTAKAAVCAGAAALLRAAAISAKSVEEVWIAGSFGAYLDLHSAASVGLLPDGLAKKAKSVGNTSLAGAKKLLLHPKDEQQLQTILDNSVGIRLADDSFFKDDYIQSMDFPKTAPSVR